MWLSHCSLGSIPPTPNSNFSSLATLDLSFNSFENALIPSWVFGYQNLVALNLSANGFQGPIPIGLQNMTSLKHLDLSANNFSSSIPNWLYSFSHLEFLNLRKNLLQGTISSFIRNLARGYLVFFFFFSLLITLHSIFVTHHLKYLNSLNPTRLALIT